MSTPEIPASGDGEVPTLDTVESEVVAIFVSAADLLGFPRSLGEIYGLAYISPTPIHLAEVCARLRMSKGSASQGLRTLRDVGALKPVYVAGDRRDFFEPELKIRVLLYRLLAERLRPHLDRSESILKSLQTRETADDGVAAPVRAFRKERLSLLSAWQKRISLFLPLLQKLLK